MRSRIDARSQIGGWLVVLAVVLVGSYDVSAAPRPVTVEVKGFKFTPQSVTVAPGTTVTWRNNDEDPHTITSTDGAFGSSALESAGRFSYTFTKPGRYQYFCKLHPHMRAEVVVR